MFPRILGLLLLAIFAFQIAACGSLRVFHF